MAVTEAAIGAKAEGTTGAVTYTAPGGQSGKFAVLYVETNVTTGVTAPTGWTHITGSPRAQGSNVVCVSIMTRQLDGTGNDSPSVAAVANHQVGFIVAYNGVDLGNPIDGTPVGDGTATTTTPTPAAPTTTVNGSRVVQAVTNQFVSTITSPANAGLSGFAQVDLENTALGNAGTIGVFAGDDATAGAVADSTMTFGTTGVWSSLSFALRASTGGATVSGDAAPAFTATVSPSAVSTRLADSSPAFGVTVSASAGLAVAGSATVPVTAGIVAAAAGTRPASTTVPVSVAITASALVSRPTDATVPVSATVVASAVASHPASSSVPTTAAVTASAVGVRPVSTTVPVTATITATATVGAAPISADSAPAFTATITATAQGAKPVSAAPSFAVGVTPSATAVHPATASLATSAGVVASAVVGPSATVAASFTATVTAAAAGARPVSTTVPISATITASASVVAAATATLAVTAGITVDGNVPVVGWGPPNNLTATAVSSTQIDLVWDAVAAASGYDLERDGVIIATDVVGTTYSDTGRSGGVTYNYRARSVRA